MLVKVKREWTVLKFGIGRAGFRTFYSKIVGRTIGLDIYDYLFLHPGIEFIVSDGKIISPPDESVDLVVSHSVWKHVVDLIQAVTEINRVLKLGGFAFLTVPLLYFSITDSRVNDPETLGSWGHLKLASKCYHLANPIVKTGALLYKLTSARMLWALGHTPVDILHYEIRTERKAAPDWLTEAEMRLIDIYTAKFGLLAHKNALITRGGAVQIA